jgi:hypothetical protein
MFAASKCLDGTRAADERFEVLMQEHKHATNLP